MQRLLLTLILLLAATAAAAATVKLAWEPSGSDNVAGYKVYYRANSGELPLAGTEAAQGASPIDVGNVTEASLDLPAGHAWHFRATAYNAAGYESTLSNEAVADWTTPQPPQNLQISVTVRIDVQPPRPAVNLEP